MKKFSIAFLILFIANIGCKKMDLGGDALCGCSPMPALELHLVIKNQMGEDLLNTNTTGSYTKEKIRLFRKDTDGKEITLNFSIRPPFSYESEKFTFNQLSTGDLLIPQGSKNTLIYLKLGEGAVREVEVQIGDKNPYKVDQVKIDQELAIKDSTSVSKYLSIFYIVENF